MVEKKDDWYDNSWLCCDFHSNTSNFSALIMNYKKHLIWSFIFVIFPFITSWIAGLIIITYPDVYDSISSTIGLSGAHIITDALSSTTIFLLSQLLALVVGIYTLFISSKNKKITAIVISILLVLVSGVFLFGMLYRILS